MPTKKTTKTATKKTSTKKPAAKKPEWKDLTADEILTGLEAQGYYANKEIAYSVLGATRKDGAPLLIEGDPGVGKTSLAVAVAKMLNVPLIRISCHEGITADKILYDYDYQRQLLVVSAIKEKLRSHFSEMSLDESIRSVAGNAEFYGESFLLKRPIYSALTMPGRKVLLIDEIDKADAEIEHALLEVLSDFALTIPEYGTVVCKPEDRPIVFLTSNNYRQLSGPLLRRCWYLYLEHKTKEEIKAIIAGRVAANEEFVAKVSDCIYQLQTLVLKHPISISEGLEWARCLNNMFGCNSAEDIRTVLPNTIGALAKDQADKRIVEGRLRGILS